MNKLNKPTFHQPHSDDASVGVDRDPLKPRRLTRGGNLMLLLFGALVWLSVGGAGLVHSATLPLNFVETTIGGGWNECVGIVFANDGRMFVWERGGRVWIVENGVKLPTPLIDIHDEVGAWRDYGLLGFALDPNFYSNGYIYLFYVVDHYYLNNFGTPGYDPTVDEYFMATIGRITRYTAKASDGFHTVDPNSRKILVGESISTGFPIVHQSHGVGSLVFGADGTLLASCGDGASYNSTDTGSASETYYVQALADGILRPKENIGAYRAQLVDCLNGKVIRVDAATGDGVSSNPHYDPSHPRSARSRVWAMGLRNPCRITRRPGTGNSNPSAGDPGVLYIGDVGWNTWESLHVATHGGMNFGWPAFEGMEIEPSYYNSNTENQDAPNPLFGSGGCSQQYFYFRDLLIQDTLNLPSWPNPCDNSQPIPSSLDRFVHTRPAIDWQHGSGPARTGIYSGNNAAVINVGAPGSPVSGPQFGGNCSIGGVWYGADDFPTSYKNTYFHAEYGAQWIKNFTFDQSNKPVSVRNFLDAGGGIVFVATDPVSGGLYYISWSTEVRKISYAPGVNQPPTAAASADVTYGRGPLTVQFTGSDSTDPEGFLLTYLWNFGDGSPNSTAANPSHTFTAPAGVPTPYTVTLTVSDPQNATATATLVISVNNTPPRVVITSPIDGCVFPMTGDTVFNLTANISDAEHGPNQLTCQWQTILHHNNHEHPDPIDSNCTTTTTISPIGCDGNTYYYRTVLKVTDAAGLSTTAEARLYPDCPNQAPVAIGLQGDYFDNIDLTNQRLSRIDPIVNFDWGSGSPDPDMGVDTFSARWTGKIQPQFTETYTFYTVSDDGIRLWIDNNLVIDSWIDQAPAVHSGTWPMRAGVKSDIKIEYYENGGGAVAQMYWSSPSTPTALVPQSCLYPPRTPVVFQQDSGVDGIVAIEAEDNTFNLSQGGSAWTASSPSGYSGTGALQATPNTGAIVDTGYAANSPRLDFPVNFVKTGTHYVWIRGIGLSGNDDSCHVGLDGAEIATSDRISGFGAGWTWSRDTMDGVVATFNVASAGIHTVNVWMREDGFIIDKLLLSVNSSYTPTGAGPAESLRLSDGPPIISDIPDQMAVEDNPITTDFTIADPAATFENLILTGSSSNIGLVPNANIAFGGCGASRMVTIIPAANQSGTSTITVTVNNGTKSAGDTFVLTVKPDSDGDGIPDDWELAQGLNPNNPSDASIDSDGDGFTNLQEFLAGTAPHDPANALAIADMSESGADMAIDFATVAGRKYRVEHNPAFPIGPWTTVADNVLGTGGIVRVTDFSATSQSKCFYRVTLLP